MNRFTIRCCRLLTLALLMTCISIGNLTAAETDIARPQELVDQAMATYDHFTADPEMTTFRELLPKAQAVMIVPRLLKGGFILGGSGGSGVLMSRDPKSGLWSYPAFYTMGSVSIGAQIGAQSSEVILIFMTAKGVDTVLATSAKLGADISVAAGPVGAGKGAQTADVLSFSRSKGAYGGISAEGSVLKVREEWNTEYYGKPVRPLDILVQHTVSNSQANALRVKMAHKAGE